MSSRTIVVNNYPHTKVLKEGIIPIAGVEAEFPTVAPIEKAFARMVRGLEFDVSEMAIATFLQAREAKIPVTLLPLVMVGTEHHGSIKAWPGKKITPAHLKGEKIGVRAYSQTTGLWVRGILREEFGLESGDMTWLTTEGTHVSQYVEPSYTERTTAPLGELLRDGEIVATIAFGPSIAVGDEKVTLDPVIPNPDEANAAWAARHQTIPINHMVTVQTDFLNSDPQAVRSIYSAFTRAIDETASERGDAARDRAIRYGLTDDLLRAVEVAIQYALEQELIREEITAEELFADSVLYSA